MAYYIFLKSSTSLEEFRKNPHVKIPPKSPCANFQSLGIFKNQIFIRKRIFPVTFDPVFFLPVDFPSPLPLGLGLLAGLAHRTAQPATFFLHPHRRRARTALPPAGLAPPPRSPRRLHRKERNGSINPHHFPHYSTPFPLFNNR
jgi:hypothetical protein